MLVNVTTVALLHTAVIELISLYYYIGIHVSSVLLRYKYSLTPTYMRLNNVAISSSKGNNKSQSHERVRIYLFRALEIKKSDLQPFTSISYCAG